MSETRARALLVVAGLLALVGIACPRPVPTPVTPPDADAAQPTPAPAASCLEACAHANLVCPGNHCSEICPGAAAWDDGYVACVMAATGCYNCDATARAGAKRK